MKLKNISFWQAWTRGWRVIILVMLVMASESVLREYVERVPERWRSYAWLILFIGFAPIFSYCLYVLLFYPVRYPKSENEDLP